MGKLEGADMIARPENHCNDQGMFKPWKKSKIWCGNKVCHCTGACMAREVEQYWGTEAAKQWERGLKDA